jgi:hypothetical protein
MMKYWVSILAVMFISGCVSDSKISYVGAPKYRDKYTVGLTVKYLDVVNSYVAPEREPHVEHMMPFRLCDYATEWAHHRLKPQGKKGFAIVTIEQASIVQVPLSKQKMSWMGSLNRCESDRFDAELALRIDFMDYKGFPNGVAFAKVRRSQTILENTPIDERQNVLQKLSVQIIDALDEELEKNLRHNAPKLIIES